LVLGAVEAVYLVRSDLKVLNYNFESLNYFFTRPLDNNLLSNGGGPGIS